MYVLRYAVAHAALASNLGLLAEVCGNMEYWCTLLETGEGMRVGGMGGGVGGAKVCGNMEYWCTLLQTGERLGGG